MRLVKSAVCVCVVQLCVLANPFGALPARADTFNVGAGDVAGLKGAIVVANVNGVDDIINLAGGADYPIGNFDNSVNGFNGLPVIRPDSGHQLTINGNSSTIRRDLGGAVPNFRLIYVAAGSQLTLNNLGLADGHNASINFTGSSGGAIFNDQANLTLNTCSVLNNSIDSSGDGGAIINFVGNLTLNSCSFSNNTTGGSGIGGAISNYSGSGTATLNMTGTQFIGNISNGGRGGAIANTAITAGNANITADQCTFSSNTTFGTDPGAGGALSTTADTQSNSHASVTLAHTTLNSNAAIGTAGRGRGGAIYSVDSTLSLLTCTLSGNTTTPNGFANQAHGGGVYLARGSATMNATTFQQNNASHFGGGIYCDSANLTLSSCSVNNNASNQDGGGLASFGYLGSVTLNNTTFSQNFAVHEGGAIYNKDAALTATNGNFTGNHVGRASEATGGSGGALYNFVGRVTLTNCILAQNSADSDPTLGTHGGAIYNLGNPSDDRTVAVLTLVRCTLSGNSVSGHPLSEGGGIFNTATTGSAPLTLKNCTLSQNSAPGFGGGLRNSATTGSAPVLVQNCTFDRNTAGTGGGIYCSRFSTGNATLTIGSSIFKHGSAGANIVAVDTATTSSGFNLSSDGAGGGGGTGPDGYLNASTDIRNTDPLLDPAGPQPNDGFTPTVALLVGSPAVDKGKDLAGTGIDQRGFPRKVNFPSVPNATGGDGSDIGAFEAQDFSQSGHTLTVNKLSDHDDGVCGLLDCTLREAVTIANAQDGADTINFATGLAGTITLSMGELPIISDVTVNGPTTAVIAISGNHASRIFNATAGSLALARLTLVNGQADGSEGGAINCLNGVTVSLNACALTNNHADNGLGGAIFSQFSTVNLTNCTLWGNHTDGGIGGAILNYLSSTLTVTNCTLAANRAGGASGQGGAIVNSLGTAKIGNSIVASNTAATSPNIDGPVTSLGYNLIGNGVGSSGFTGSGDLVGTAAAPINPKLGAIQNYGGPTSTFSLLSGSPALDRGKRIGVTTDQRGLPRPSDDAGLVNAAGGDGSDIGAYEFQVPATIQFSATAFAVTESTSTVTLTVTRTGNLATAVNVSYATANGTAQAGSDYAAATGFVSFAATQTSKTFLVQILNNAGCESIENLAVSLSSPTAGGALGTPTTATVTIYDDDCSYAINGRVANSSGTGIPNVQITRTGGANVITNSNGNYTFVGVKQGAYTIAPLISPSLNGVTFNPASYNVTVNTSSLNNINFTATFTVTGRVSNSAGTGIPNIQVTRKTATTSVTAVTNANGVYTFTGVRSGSYTMAPVVTPSMTGISFFPTSTNITVSTSNLTNINFTAFTSISGKITTSAGAGIANVLVTRSAPGSSTSVLTDSGGNYIFTGVRAGSYTITPSKSGLTFNPTSRSVNAGTTNLTNINFIGS